MGLGLSFGVGSAPWGDRAVCQQKVTSPWCGDMVTGRTGSYSTGIRMEMKHLFLEEWRNFLW